MQTCYICHAQVLVLLLSVGGSRWTALTDVSLADRPLKGAPGGPVSCSAEQVDRFQPG